MQNPKVIIYAAEIKNKVAYVGQTWELRARIRGHKNCRSSIKKFVLAGVVKFRVLRCVPPFNASRIEGQIILAYKRKGQCQFNAVIPKDVLKPKRTYGSHFLHLPTGIVFSTLEEAGRHVGCTGGTVRNRIKRDDGEFVEITE